MSKLNSWQIKRWVFSLCALFGLLVACAPQTEKISATRPMQEAVASTLTPPPSTKTAVATPSTAASTPTTTPTAVPIIPLTVTPLPSPTANPVPLHTVTEPPLFRGGDVRLAGWSLHGRFLAYFTHTQEQLDAVPDIPGVAEGDFHFYDTVTGEICERYPLSGTYSYEGSRPGRRFIWLPDGALFIITMDGEVIRADRPCGEDEEITAVFSEPIHYIESLSPDGTRLLLAGQEYYWFYDRQTQALTAIPEVVPDSFNNLVWSPDGTYLAVTLAGNYTGQRDPVGGTRVVRVSDGAIVARHDWEPANALDGTFGGPVWLSDTEFLVTLTLDQGPFLMTVEGDVRSALSLFGFVPQGNVKQIEAYVEPESGDYHLLLTDWSGPSRTLRPLVYHSDTEKTEAPWPGWNEDDQMFLRADGNLVIHRNGHFLVRPVADETASFITYDESSPCVNPWRSPETAVVGSGQGHEGRFGLYAMPDCPLIGEVQIGEEVKIPAAYLYGSVSPDSRHLALMPCHGGGRCPALFVISLDFMEN